MTIRFRCPECQKGLSAADDHAGAKFKCPQCGRQNVIPEPQAPPPRLPPSAPGEPEPEPVRFSVKRGEDEGIDMTPMVDVTFLLLIFFMVTAAYSLQKSKEVPAPDTTEASTQTRTYEEILENDDFVIIRIAGDNTVWVDEQEAPSEQEVLVKLREAREGMAGGSTRGPTSLLVRADPDAFHKTVVMCLDAGDAVGMENVRFTVMPDDF
ncbi:MAG: ExbD/TolR family protein [Planctomycetota bacterium]|jgi:biopolymer transport protein ExbD